MDTVLSRKQRLLSASTAAMRIVPKPELVFEQGQGDWLFDTEGRRYLDWVQGWAVNCLGHAHPELVAVTQHQAGRLFHCGPAYHNAPMIELAEKLAALSCADQIFFTSSGAEANEGALKLARKWGARHRNGAHEVITFNNGFHGRTLSMMAASGKAEWDSLFEPKTPGFRKAVYNDIASVRALVGAHTAAVMLELVQGEGGVISADPQFVRDLRALCDEQGILLIADEVQTGVGRTGTLFAYERFGVQPDIVTLGKGLGGGVPIAALLAREAVCCFEPGDQGGTYNGNPLVCAVAGKVLDIVGQPTFLAQVAARSAYLRQALETLCQRHGHKQVRGHGLLLALELNCPDAKAIVAGALEAGLLINAPRDHLLRFMPALNIEQAAIDHGIAILDRLLAQSAKKGD